MKAILQGRYGSPDVLELGEIDKPRIADDEVLVRVHAAGVDRGVWHLMTGLPYLVRVMGFGLRRPKARVPGRDAAGRVESVGRAVTRVRPGDAVFGICRGSFAEYAVANERSLEPKPASLSFEEAAAIPTSGMTALQALRDAGEVKRGQTVLVIGASGGVGTFAVQIAKALGAEVTGVCSTTKTSLVRSIGADHVIDYTREEVAGGQRRYDVILDIAGNRSLTYLRRALAPAGTLVIVGGEGGGRWLGGVDRQLRATLLSPLVRNRLRPFFAEERGEDLHSLRVLVENGTLMPVIDRTWPLDGAAEAVSYLAGGYARGKIVLAKPDGSLSVLHELGERPPIDDVDRAS